MKKIKGFLFLLFLLFLSPISTLNTSVSLETNKGYTINVWIVLHFRDYITDLPISNISVAVTIDTPFPPWRKHIGPLRINKTGTIQSFLGELEIRGYTRGELEKKTTNDLRKIASNIGISEMGGKTELIKRIMNAQQLSEWKKLLKSSSLLELQLSDNYTLIKVGNRYLEETRYTADYVANITMYKDIQMNLAYTIEDNSTLLVEGNIWLLKGKVIRVSDCNPISGDREPLFLNPAVKTEIGSGESDYESYYLVPINYRVKVFYKVRSWEEYETRKSRLDERIFSPFTVKVDENTTVINWMLHAAREYVNWQKQILNKELEWLKSCGYPLERENAEYEAIEKLLNRVLELYENREYISALGGAKISDRKLTELKNWIAETKTLAVLTTIGISLFAYGLASLASSLIFEEQTERKKRLIMKVIFFSALMLVFSITHPALKIAFTFIIGARHADLPLSFMGCFVVAGLTYFLIQLTSLKKKPMGDLALQLGVRSLKRRLSRTILTLTTITIIVSSAIIFVNVSLSRETKVNRQWEGTSIPGVIVKPDTRLAPVSEYDVNWARSQEWCLDVGYREGIRAFEITREGSIRRTGLLMIGEETIYVDIVGIDPAFVKDHYNLTGRFRGSLQEFVEGRKVAIIPSTFGATLNEYVTLAVEELIEIGGGRPERVKRPLREFRVVGTFDPATVSINLTKIDNTPLFKDPSALVLVPIKSIRDPSITISEITILTKEEFNPVNIAEELAYSLAATVVANKDKLAQEIVWSIELSVSGLIPFTPPLLIACLMMYTTMASVYEERRREFTTLATLGLDPKNTFRVFLIEALLLGLIGTFLGFFCSYILRASLFHLMDAVAPSYVHWSMPAILVALLTGVFTVFLGAYVPAVRAKGLSLMGREERRRIIGELVSEGEVTSFQLPIRESIQNGEMLYTYVKETLGKFKKSLVDRHSVKGEIYRDGTFKVSFIALGVGRSVLVPCEIKGTLRDGDVIVPIIEFPTRFKSYDHIRNMLRDLEEYMIGYSAWKETRLELRIVREAPKRRETLEEILVKIRDIINHIKDYNRKLSLLERRRPELSEEIYNEFKEKYVKLMEEKMKILRSTATILKPYRTELKKEIAKTKIEVERLTIARNLDEISEEEYVRKGGPLQARLDTLREKLKEIDDIFEFLKGPVRLT